jgi:hypothetical protein
VTLHGWWDPGWYNLDQPLKAGRRDTFAFLRAGRGARPGYDLVFANTVGGDWDDYTATVVSIEHAGFGALDEVDTVRFGEYTFRFRDGRWVSIEAEQGPGHVNAASPGFPVGSCDPAWADTSGWALTVTLADVAATKRRRR